MLLERRKEIREKGEKREGGLFVCTLIIIYIGRIRVCFPLVGVKIELTPTRFQGFLLFILFCTGI